MHWRRTWQPTPVFLPGESQGQGSLVGCRLYGHTESDTTEGTWHAYMHVCVLNCFSHVRLCATIWTAAHQAPLSMGFSRQEYWSGLSCPSPRDLADPGIKPVSLTSPALAGRFFTTSATWEAHKVVLVSPSCLTLCDPMDWM